MVGWTLLWIGVFAVGTVMEMVMDIPDNVWLWHWVVRLGLSISVGFVMVAIITIGGIANMLEMFKYLATTKRDEFDDGTVADGHNLADEETDS